MIMKISYVKIDKLFNFKLYDLRDSSIEELKENNEISDLNSSVKRLVEDGDAVKMNHFDDIFYNHVVLATIWHNDDLVSCGALKVPYKGDDKDYKKYVFSSAKSKIDCQTIERELGWLVTDKDYRRKGFCNNIVKALLKYNKEQLINKPLYATAREDKLEIHRILETNNFHRTGVPYNSCRGDYKLFLYTNSIINTSNNAISNVVEVHQFKQDFLDKMENPEKFAIMNEKTFSCHIGYQRQHTSNQQELEGLLKITNPKNNKSIYRKFRFDPTVEDNRILLSLTARSELGFYKTFLEDTKFYVSVRKANWFCYYWKNSDSSIRSPFKLAVISLFITVFFPIIRCFFMNCDKILNYIIKFLTFCFKCMFCCC